MHGESANDNRVREPGVIHAAVAFAQQSPLKFSRLGVSTYNKTCTEVALGNFRQPILASEGWQSG